MKTLDKFIDDGLRTCFIGHDFFRGHNAYVRYPRFAALYVRISQRKLGERMYRPVLDLANIEVGLRYRSKGVFTRLVKSIRKKHPEMPIFVESVLTDRFADKLTRMGFTKKHENELIAPSFYLLPGEELKER